MRDPNVSISSNNVANFFLIQFCGKHRNVSRSRSNDRYELYLTTNASLDDFIKFQLTATFNYFFSNRFIVKVYLPKTLVFNAHCGH